MDWQRDIRDFETWLRLEKGLADNSVEAYLRDVGQMRRFMEDQGVEPEAVTLEHLQLFNCMTCFVKIAIDLIANEKKKISHTEVCEINAGDRT